MDDGFTLLVSRMVLLGTRSWVLGALYWDLVPWLMKKAEK